MKRSAFIGALAAVLMAGATLGAHAQSIVAPTEGVSADELIGLGLKTLRQIDAGHIAELWDEGSAVLKTRAPQAEFLEGVRKSRQQFGAVARRGWAQVTRIRYLDDNPAKLPGGLYANVDFASEQPDGKTFYEVVSFRLEAGGVWRLTGYIPRQKQ